VLKVKTFWKTIFAFSYWPLEIRNLGRFGQEIQHDHTNQARETANQDKNSPRTEISMVAEVVQHGFVEQNPSQTYKRNNNVVKF
jgi:hypothetical protein